MDLRLPPHIKVIQGMYFNTSNNRWVGEYKIQKICDDYWNGIEGDAVTITNSNGITLYKKEIVKPESSLELDIIKTPNNDIEQAFDIVDEVNSIKDEITLDVPIIDKSELPTCADLIDKFKRKKVDKKLDEPKKVVKPVQKVIKKTTPKFKRVKMDIEPQKSKEHIITDETGMLTELATEKNPVILQALLRQESKLIEEKTCHYIDLPVISGYELTEIEEVTYFNTPSIMFLLETHESLEILLQEILKGYGVDWFALKEGKKIIQDTNGNGFWYEEYMAIVCHILYTNLPISDKIEWLSKFLNRSGNEVVNLLGIHYREYWSNKGYQKDYYTDFYCDINCDLTDYFLRYYKFDRAYIYRGEKTK